MVTLGEIFRRYGPAYRAQFGDQLSTEQVQAMHATLQCRTEALGGHVYTCAACATTRYSYHSCRNRHCPTCQQDASQAWLAHRQCHTFSSPSRCLLVCEHSHGSTRAQSTRCSFAPPPQRSSS